jgi:IS30 family transposase
MDGPCFVLSLLRPLASIFDARQHPVGDLRSVISISFFSLRDCDPRSPWQRGSNENTNGLLRHYLPRGTDFSRISQSYLNAIALRLNQRPRKTLGFQTPADRLQAVLH